MGTPFIGKDTQKSTNKKPEFKCGKGKKKKNGTGRKNLQGQKQVWRSVGKWKPAGTRVSQQALPFHNFFPFHWKLVINQLAPDHGF